MQGTQTSTYMYLQTLGNTFDGPHISNTSISQIKLDENKCYKKSKFQLGRKSLKVINQYFIRPILEYGDVLSYNCTQGDKKGARINST
jgi:hypothetical protein